MAATEYSVVLRFAGMSPSDIGGYEAHRYRKYGDLGHVDRNKPKPEILIGSENWARDALFEIETIKMENFAAELVELDRRNRRKDLNKRRIEGPRDPWRASRHGPMREVILTANKKWFDHVENSDEEFNTAREEQFQEHAISWLTDNFGADVIHARADRDEQAYHIHAVIMPRATVQKYGMDCQMLQPSVHPLIRDYEAAQDSVGAWFNDIGLVRGKTHKRQLREALNNGQEPPLQPHHVRPAEWRAQEEVRLTKQTATLEVRKRELSEREDIAESVISYADAVSSGEIDEDGRSLKQANTAKEQITPDIRISLGFKKARAALRAVARRLAVKAKERAEQKADARIVSELAEIKKADETIVEIARQLPVNLRERIAKMRRKLTASIMTLDPSTKGRDQKLNRDRGDYQ